MSKKAKKHSSLLRQFPATSRRIFLRFLKVFFVLVIFHLMLGTLLFIVARHNTLETQLHALRQKVELLTRKTNVEMQSYITDLQLLAHDKAITDVVRDPSEKNQQELESLFYHFIASKRFYDKVRYIDEEGQEIVRVNWDGQDAIVVSRSDLQSKAHRYYFRETVSLPADAIWFSLLDLNMEYGEVERPHKPVIRLITPVKGAQGENRGILVLNLLAAPMLERLRCMGTDPGMSLEILNAEGYWLLSDQSEREFSFMFPNLRKQAFADIFPEIWQCIQQGEEDYIISRRGIFVFATAQITIPGHLAGNAVNPPEWFFVKRIYPHAIWFLHPFTLGTLLFLSLLYMLFLAVGTWAIIYSLTVREENQAKHEQIRAIQKMAATIAHEFNTPLAVIKTNCEMCSSGMIGPDKYEASFKKIEHQVEKMGNLVQRMLKMREMRERRYTDTETILDVSDEE